MPYAMQSASRLCLLEALQSRQLLGGFYPLHREEIQGPENEVTWPTSQAGGPVLFNLHKFHTTLSSHSSGLTYLNQLWRQGSLRVKGMTVHENDFSGFLTGIIRRQETG